MALIACPECAKQISSSAPTCPHCGAPVAKRYQEPAPVVVREGCFLQTLNFGCIGCAGLIIIFIILAVV